MATEATPISQPMRDALQAVHLNGSSRGVHRSAGVTRGTYAALVARGLLEWVRVPNPHSVATDGCYQEARVTDAGRAALGYLKCKRCELHKASPADRVLRDLQWSAQRWQQGGMGLAWLQRQAARLSLEALGYCDGCALAQLQTEDFQKVEG